MEVISTNNYYDSIKTVCDILSKRQVNLDVKHYIIAPDRHTLQIENMLYNKVTLGALDIDVLSFSRLCTKICSNDSFLPKAGAVMLLDKIVKENAKKLKCFNKSVKFSGFSAKLYETFICLKSSNIEPSDMQDFTDLGVKIADVAFLYDEFIKAVQEFNVDSSGRMDILINQIINNDYKNIHFYFVGFDRFTKKEQRIMELLDDKSASVKLIDTVLFEPKYGIAEFYKSPDFALQLKAVAKRIRANVVNGYKYSDMCLVANDVNYSQIKRIFDEFEIPFYLDKKLILGSQPLVLFLKQLSQTIEEGFKRVDFIRLSKNFYSGIDLKSAYYFENYCNKYSIEKKEFFEPFVDYSNKKGNIDTEEKEENLIEEIEQPKKVFVDKQYKKAEEVRIILVDLINKFKKGYQKVTDGNSFYDFIIKYLKEIKSDKKIIVLSKIADNDLTQVEKKLIENLELIKKVFATTKNKFSIFLEMFFEGLDSVEISLLPQYDDVVIVGDVTGFRGHKYKFGYVVDFCDGSVPKTYEDSAIILDSEVDILKSVGLDFFPKAEELNQLEKIEFLHFCASCQHLFFGYMDIGEKRISLLHTDIKNNCKKYYDNSYSAEIDFLSSDDKYYQYLNGHDAEYQKIVSRHISSPQNALELYLNGLSGTSYKPSFFAELNDIVSKRDEYNSIVKNLNFGVDFRQDYLLTANDLFFKKLTTSISRIQTYFKCPYMHFLQIGLKLKEREKGELLSTDIGSFLHSAVELFVKKGDFENPALQMRQIVDELKANDIRLSFNSNKALFKGLEQECFVYADVISKQIKNSDFKPYLQEAKFGKEVDSVLKPITFKLKDRDISMVGVIDRIDKYSDNYATVIDYKSGMIDSTSVNLKTLYCGANVQLPLYAKILEENVLTPAGIFYFPLSSKWADDEFRYRFKGNYIDDRDVIIALDNSLTNVDYKSTIISATTTKKTDKDTGLSIVGGRSSSRVASGALKNLADYAVLVCQNGYQEISKGYISPKPLQKTCDYCKYKVVCGEKEKARQVRELNETITTDFIANVVLKANEEV